MIKIQNLYLEDYEEEKVLDEKKDTKNEKKIGPLVKMLKTLDDKGLLQECMQHYIDI